MLKKVKNWLGIEGVKVALVLPEEFSLKSEVVEGSFVITSQSEQYVQKANLSIKERYKRGRRKSKLIDEYTLGTMSVDIGEMIVPETELSKEFVLPFSQMKSPIDNWGDKNILYKGISKLAKIAKNAHSTFEILVELEVEGNRLKPYDTQVIVSK